MDSLKNEETFFKVKLIRLVQKLNNTMGQFNHIDGTHNVWIVKPSYTARGVGIYCTRDINQIIHGGKKTQ